MTKSGSIKHTLKDRLRHVIERRLGAIHSGITFFSQSLFEISATNYNRIAIFCCLAVFFARPIHSTETVTENLPGQLYVGGGAAFFYISENSPTQDYSVAYSAPGIQLDLLYKDAAGYGFAGAIGMHSLVSLSINDRVIDLSERSQLFIPLQTSVFIDLTPDLAIGTGLDLFSFSSFYFKNKPMPDSSGTDVYFALFAQGQRPLTETIDLFAQIRVGLNLTPGTPDLVGINNLVVIRWSLNLSLLYRMP